MLQFFEGNHRCKILLEYPLEDNDTEALKSLFKKDYTHWIVEFGRIYNVKSTMVQLLYREIFINKKNISIITHKLKLNRYLHKLGLKTKFVSLLKDYVTKTSEIKVELKGGSADSSPKIVKIVQNTTLKNIALVVVQHVDETKVGIFDEILQRFTKNKVIYPKDGEKLHSGCIYIAPNNKHLKIENGYFKLSDEEKYNYSKPSVSLSYESFSSYYKESLLVVQECGYAADGVDKLEFLRQMGSKLIIQDKDECEAKPMVNNALALNQHHYVFKQDDIIAYLNFIDAKLGDVELIEYFLKMIYARYGYDFQLYNPEMIKRRIESFMINNRVKNIHDAVSVILFNRSMFKSFFLEVSINVTEFFRNPDSFKDIVKFLKKEYTHKYNIKVWSAGCSNGKESYSVGIILKHLGLLDKSIIYATDFNSVVIDEAKNALYSNEAYLLGMKNFDAIGLDDTLNNYVVKNENFITIDKSIQEKTLFFQHNLVEDSSFNEFDIIICKNVIIYFNQELQEKVFGLFYDSLKFGGHLVLGKSESIHSAFIDKFEKFSNDCKIYKKVK